MAVEGTLFLAFLFRLVKDMNVKMPHPLLNPGEDVNTPKQTPISEEKKRDIEGFATTKIDNEYTVYSELPRLFAPHIAGNDMLKLAMCYALASTPEKPLHLLMIGEPATVKTDMLLEAKQIFPQAVLGSPRSTKAGLTIDSNTGQQGLLLLADKGVALLDELDKMGKNELNVLFESLSNGTVSINTSKIHKTYPSRLVCLAASNPKGGRFKNNVADVKKQIEETIPIPLISRFNLVFLI